MPLLESCRDSKEFQHISPVLHNLHWLPVTKRKVFKILTITYKLALNGMAPSYICDLLQVHHPNRNLRHGSASRGLSWSLVVPAHQTQAYARCSLFLCSYTYSQKFDSFPVDIKNAQTLFLFKRKHKTFLFNQFLTFVKRAEIMQLRHYYYYYSYSYYSSSSSSSYYYYYYYYHH